MFFLSLLIPGTDPVLQILFVFFWGSTLIGTLVYVRIHGTEFVDIPHLVRTAEKEKVS
jgi:hypothetical protein